MNSIDLNDIIIKIYKELSILMLDELNGCQPELPSWFTIVIKKNDIDISFDKTVLLKELETFLSDYASCEVVDDETSNNAFEIAVDDVLGLISCVPSNITEYVPEWEVLVDTYRKETLLREDEMLGGRYFRLKVTILWLTSLNEKRKQEESLQALNSQINLFGKLVESWINIDAELGKYIYE